MADRTASQPSRRESGKSLFAAAAVTLMPGRSNDGHTSLAILHSTHQYTAEPQMGRHCSSVSPHQPLSTGQNQWCYYRLVILHEHSTHQYSAEPHMGRLCTGISAHQPISTGQNQWCYYRLVILHEHSTDQYSAEPHMGRLCTGISAHQPISTGKNQWYLGCLEVLHGHHTDLVISQEGTTWKLPTQ